MAIILEGFDGAGKSTLASKLKFPVKHAGGPPKTLEQLKKNLREQMEECGNRVILDRVTCISHQVYGGNMYDNSLMAYLHAMMDCKNSVLVYCRPPDEVLFDFSKHEVKEHDSAEHIEDLKQNMRTYIDRYDQLMSKVTHVRYDYTMAGDEVAFINGLIHSQVKL